MSAIGLATSPTAEVHGLPVCQRHDDLMTGMYEGARAFAASEAASSAAPTQVTVETPPAAPTTVEVHTGDSAGAIEHNG